MIYFVDEYHVTVMKQIKSAFKQFPIFNYVSPLVYIGRSKH